MDFINPELFSKFGDGFIGMLFGLALGLPTYVCATASVPLAAEFVRLDVTYGAILVFLMAGPATNIATISIISKTLGKKIVYIYLITIFICSITFGFIINKLVIIDLNNFHHHMNHNNFFHILSGLLLFVICFYAIIDKFFFDEVSAISTACKETAVGSATAASLISNSFGIS